MMMTDDDDNDDGDDGGNVVGIDGGDVIIVGRTDPEDEHHETKQEVYGFETMPYRYWCVIY